MKSLRYPIWIMILSLALLAAARPIAMRVDVRIVPTDSSDNARATLEVATTIAPEDRGRIGTAARMRIKLVDGDTTILHKLVDVDVDDQGTAYARIDAPAGTFEIEISLIADRGEAEGLWQGTVAVPVPAPGSQATLVNPHEPAAKPKTDIESSPSQRAVEPETTTSPTSAQEITEPESSVVATAAAAAPPEAATGSSKRQGTADSPTTVNDPDPKMAPAIPPAPVALAAAEPQNTPPPAQPTTAPQDVPHVTEPPLPAATVAPLLHEAPIAFLIALDVADENFDRAQAVARQFIHVAELNHLDAFEILPKAQSSSSALQRLAAALDTVPQPPGGATLVLVTDGLKPLSRDEWKAADAAILQADARLLAVGLWSNEFISSSRKNLGRIAVYSGGRFYLLQPSESPASVVSFFGLQSK